jgi:hypothetical protein
MDTPVRVEDHYMFSPWHEETSYIEQGEFTNEFVTEGQSGSKSVVNLEQ